MGPLGIQRRPGAQIYFDTACAAIICLLLSGLGWLAYHWRVRLRVALPCLVLTAALAIGLGNVLNREIVRVELAGSRNAPAVVITRGESAVVLFRGGSSTQQAVETLLTRRGAREVEMLVDLRMNPRTPCTLEARERIAADEMPRYSYPPCPQQPGRAGSAASTEWLHRPHHGGGAAVCCPERERPVGKACPG